jgi:hypothetical protein
MDEIDSFGLRVFTERVEYLFPRGRLAPVHFNFDGVQSKRPGHSHPSRTELAAICRNHGVARGKKADERGFHASGPGTGERQYRLICLENVLQVLIDPLEDLPEFRMAVVDDRFCHLEHDRFRNGRRAGGEQTLLQSEISSHYLSEGSKENSTHRCDKQGTSCQCWTGDDGSSNDEEESVLRDEILWEFIRDASTGPPPRDLQTERIVVGAEHSDGRSPMRELHPRDVWVGF